MNKLFLVLIGILAGLGKMSASTYYVKTNGNDSLSGTSLANAWLTIQHGLNAVAPGDTLIITNGFFPEAEPQTKVSGTQANPITLISATPGYGGTILTNGLEVFHQWYVIQGFTFWCYTNANGRGPYGQGLGLYAPNQGHALVISNFFCSPPIGDSRSLGFGCADGIYTAEMSTPFTNGTDFNTIIWCTWTNMFQSNSVDLACIGITGIGNLMISNWAFNAIDIDFCDHHGYSNRLCYSYFSNVCSGPLANHNDLWQTWGASGLSPLIACYESFDHCFAINCFSTTACIASQDTGIAPGAAVGTNYWMWDIFIGEPWHGTPSSGYGGAPLVQDECVGDVYANNDWLVNSNSIAEWWLRRLQDSGNNNATNIVGYNNIWSECSLIPTAIDQTSAPNYADFNFLTLNGGQTPVTIYGTHNITSGFPGWINTNSPNYDLHLTNSSRCVTGGTNLTSLLPSFLLVDAAGVSLPSSGTTNWPIGAYVFVSGGGGIPGTFTKTYGKGTHGNGTR